MRSMRLVRRSLLAVWSALLVVLLVGVLSSHLIGILGLRPYIIRGGSMEPTIPLGAVVAVGNVSLDDIRPGDVLTMRQGDRPVITHRVISLLQAPDGGVSYVTKGDANEHTDGAAVPSAAILGRVSFSLPLVGYLMAALQVPGTLISLLTGLASMLLAIKLLEDDEAERESTMVPAPASGPAPAPHHLPHLPSLPQVAVAGPEAGSGPGLAGLT